MGIVRLLKALLPRSLLGRSMLIIVAPLVLLQLIATTVFWENHWSRISTRLAQNLVGDIAALIELMRAFPAPEDRDTVFAAARRMGLVVTFDPAARLADTAAESDESFAVRETARLLGNLQRPFRIDLSEGGDKGFTIAIELSEGVLNVVASRRRVDSSSTWVFTLWLVGGAMLLFGVAMVFMRNQVRSVRRLAMAADAFGKGRDVPDFKPEGATEVRQAAVAFNRMRERLGRQIAQRTEMLAGVSHDLRTPLTRMKLQLAMMGEADGVDDLRQDIAEMERMIEGYLAFARGEGAERVQSADVVALLEDVVGRFRREGAAIDLHCEGEIQAPLRPHAVDRCLSNLLANATRYGRHIAVRAGRRDDSVEITVDDDGPGIPPERREEAFKAFFRLEGSRNPRTGGVGLGLTIARDVVRGHGGDILLENSPLGGLRVRIRLPV